MAETIGSGQLGTRKAWEAAERRWGSRPLQLNELVDGEPWPSTIGTHGFPFRAASMGISSSARDKAIQTLFRFRSSLPTGSLRTWLGDWIIFAASLRVRQRTLVWSAETLLELVNEKFHRIFEILDVASDDSTTLKLADFVGEHATSITTTVEVANRLVALARAHPDRHGLIRLVTLRGVLDVDEPNFLARASRLRPVNGSHLQPRFRSAAVAVSVARGIADEAEACGLAASLEEADEVAGMVKRCATFVERRGQFTAAEDRFFIEIERGVGRHNWSARQTAIEALSKSTRRQKSDLDRAEVWQELALPPLIAQ